MYLRGAEVIEARKYLFLSNISLLPKVKRKEDRSRWMRELNQVIYRNLQTRAEPITMGELKAKLAGLPNG